MNIRLRTNRSAFRQSKTADSALKLFQRFLWRTVQIFPKLEDIEKASREQLARWFSHLPASDTLAQKRIMERINQRFKKLGGMTPELAKKLGF